MFPRALLPVICLVASGASGAASAAVPSATPPDGGRASAEEAGPGPELPAAGVVTARRLNVRLRPDVSAPVLGQVKTGSGLVVRRLADGWCEIDYPTSLGVWIHRKLVRLDDPSAEGAPSLTASGAGARGTVTRSGARLRATPSLDRKVILAERERGTVVRVAGSAGEWLRIVPPPDLRAYVHADYVELRTGAAAGPTEAFREASEKIALAGRLLAGTEGAREGPDEAEAEGDTAPADGIAPGLDETRRALELLDEALASEGLADGEMARLRAQVRALVGRLSPSSWLRLFEEAREAHREDVDRIERRYSAKLREAKAALDSASLSHTARGVLARPAPGSDRWRLVVGETLVSELDSRGADLSAFAGKAVGVVGVRHSAADSGGLPWIEVRYVEELRDDSPPDAGAPPGGEADTDAAGDGGAL